MNFADLEFWIALAQIIGVNIVLSGDNAVVIALAARGRPGPTIAGMAAELGCDLIVMGARGLGSHTGAPFGSVARSTSSTTRSLLLVR